MSLNDVIETVKGNLKDACNEVVIDSIQCASDIMQDRRTNSSLRSESFYTGDGNVYSFEDGKAIWYITDVKNNPVLNNLEEAFKQLTQKGNYSVSQEDFARVKKAKSTVKIALDKLNLTKHNEEFSYLAIDPLKKLNKYSREEQKVIKQFFGKTAKEFYQNMQMLTDSGITETRIWILNPEYVKKQQSPVGCASWLSNVNDDSSFDADGRSVDNNGGVRGVRKVAEGDGAKKIELQNTEYEKAFNRIIQSPQELDYQKAITLLQLATNYLASKQ